MASYTTNLNLKKPAGSENVAIGDINNNMDTIDTAYGTLNSKIDTYIFNKTYSVTTSSTGAVSVETADKPHRFVGALLTSGGPGFVFRRDESYFTVFNNSMQPLANTAVTFIAYFAQYVG